MRCNRRMLCLKVKDFFILTVSFTVIIVLITVFNHKPPTKRAGPELSNNLYSRNFDNYPGKFLNNLRISNQSYCKFNYNLPAELRYDNKALKFSPELGARSPYRVLYNAVEASGTANNNDTAAVTFVTHVTPEYVHYLSEIALHWEGSLSVAAFVPESDLIDIINYFQKACSCLPQMSRVSLHLVFPHNHAPYVATTASSNNIYAHQLVSGAGGGGDGAGGAGSATTPSPDSCSMTPSLAASFRTVNHLPYPVNVARNVARTAARSDFVLVADAELIPSYRLASRFVRMLEMTGYRKPGHVAGPADSDSSDPDNINKIAKEYRSTTYVLPVFEIEQTERIPLTKADLLRLIRAEKALYFHRHVCSHCQKFPGIETWLQQDPGDRIQPLLTVKREYPFHRWEPIYIGTNQEPLYSELLSWEGKQDKMTQMLEMCLKRYRFVILDGAFLIHWPGVKRKSNDLKLRNQWRYPYLAKNMRQYTNIVNKLATQYSKTPKCKVQ